MMRVDRSEDLPTHPYAGQRCVIAHYGGVHDVEVFYDGECWQFDRRQDGQQRWLDDVIVAFRDAELADSTPVDMVDHPPHYLNKNAVIVIDEHETFVSDDGIVMRPVECVELMRRIKDPRLATAFAYLWRVAFGGKDNDDEDIRKTIWWLTDFVEHKI